jgi:hypothetical protein
VKDYELYEALKWAAFENGHYLDSTINWIPSPDESSRYIFFQVVNREIVYTKFSTWMDSSIILTYDSGNIISPDQYPLFPISETAEMYSNSEPIINKPFYIENIYNFRNDSLYVTLEIMGKSDAPIHNYDCFKYGALSFVNKK